MSAYERGAPRGHTRRRSGSRQRGIALRDREYRPIKDYAVIGDCHGAALVASDGGVDWCCLTRFDANPVLCRLLDRERGGYLAVQPAQPFATHRAYVRGTNILHTEFRTSGGRVDVIDFMPVGRQASAGVHDYVHLDAPGYLLRVIECREGSVEVRAEYSPSVDFARAPAALAWVNGTIGIGEGQPVLHTDMPLELMGSRAVGEARLEAGERRFIALGAAEKVDARRVKYLYDVTESFWKEWIDYCRYRGPYEAAVNRSALVLKLMTYAPSGGIVAAVTTSLPEEIGGGRNWDYRYCWVRDAMLTLQALASVGYSGEARCFYSFLAQVLKGPVEDLQVMYGIRMERRLEERDVAHLEGYRASRPVRVGNGAYRQRQSDLYGYILEGLLMRRALGGALTQEDKDDIAHMVEFIETCYVLPDMGLWEARTSQRHYVHSKVMCWVVVDRAIRLLGGRPDWVRLRQRMWEDLVAHGCAPGGHLVQAFDTAGDGATDAALLQVAMMDVPLDWHTLSATRIAVERELRTGDFVKRYATDDGLSGQEGAFFVCSFWLVDALLAEGAHDEAEQLFQRLLAHANDVGLYAEEANVQSGEFLGNFPQAFTHFGLIGAAVNLELSRKHGSNAVRGTYADRARRAVGATFGWRGVWEAFLHSGQFRMFSSRRSKLHK